MQRTVVPNRMMGVSQQIIQQGTVQQNVQPTVQQNAQQTRQLAPPPPYPGPPPPYPGQHQVIFFIIYFAIYYYYSSLLIFCNPFSGFSYFVFRFIFVDFLKESMLFNQIFCR